jgi:pantoate--beta-alanine ligase
MAELINKEPLASIDYISIANPENLVELVEVNQASLVSLAVYIGKTRLIDNITLTT